MGYKSEEKRKIEYLGKVMETNYYQPLTDEEYDNLLKELYQKPSIEEVKEEMIKISKGAKTMKLCHRYYYDNLLLECKKINCKWSPAEAFKHKPLMETILGVARDNPFYKNDTTLPRKVRSVLRVGAKGMCSSVGVFPLKYVDYILQNYNVNNNYYDFSCGWGNRLASALRNNVNYFGTDPNYKLVDRLNQFTKDYKETTDNQSIVDIKCSGSEIFHEEWKDKIGVAFTSTPYFGIEDYIYGEQSNTKYNNIEDWLKYYLFPTFDNIYQYLVKDGYLIINVKEISHVSFIEKMIEYGKSIGLEYLGRETLSLGRKQGGTKEKSYTYLQEEGVYFFKKI